LYSITGVELFTDEKIKAFALSLLATMLDSDASRLCTITKAGGNHPSPVFELTRQFSHVPEQAQ
jgi:hypothetical protein